MLSQVKKFERGTLTLSGWEGSPDPLSEMDDARAMLFRSSHSSELMSSQKKKLKIKKTRLRSVDGCCAE